MRKIIVFGNSGSGKSVLAKKLRPTGLAHLDLDTIAWDANPKPVRKPIDKSANMLNQFMNKHPKWVIEGCYSDLLALAAKSANEAIFMIWTLVCVLRMPRTGHGSHTNIHQKRHKIKTLIC